MTLFLRKELGIY